MFEDVKKLASEEPWIFLWEEAAWALVSQIAIDSIRLSSSYVSQPTHGHARLVRGSSSYRISDCSQVAL